MLSNDNSTFTVNRKKRDTAFSMSQTHYHDYYEIFYLVSGECRFFINHNIYNLTRGDLVIISSGELHKTTYLGAEQPERFTISFFPSDVRSLYNFIGVDDVNQCLSKGVFSIPEQRRDYIEGLMNRMIMEVNHPDELSNRFNKVYFYELFLFLIRCQRYENTSFKEVDVDNSKIQDIAAYMYENYTKDIKLSEVADRFGMSRSYLSKKFKKTTGFGFKEYIINMRINKACKLLLDSDKPVNDIAVECGFSDSNYFGDAFRNIKGISPVRYRKINGRM